MADTKLSALTQAAYADATATDEFYLNDGGTSKRVLKKDIPGLQIITTLASDAASNSTATGVEITGMATATDTGTFVFQYFVNFFSGVTTTGAKFGINHDGTQTLLMAFMRYASTGTAATTGALTMAAAGATGNIHESFSTRAASTTSPNLGPTVQNDSAGAANLVVIEGLIKVTVAGNLELWHASETTAICTVAAGTTLLLTRVL